MNPDEINKIKQDIYKLIDQYFEAYFAKPTADTPEVSEGEVVDSTPTVKKELPEGKRAVRTKTTGDRVYLLDEKEMTKRWITSPEVLEGMGFGLADVVEIEDAEFHKYKISTAQ